MVSNADAVIFVPSVEHWKVRPQAFDETFTRPAQTANGLRELFPRAGGGGRVHIRGIVTGSVLFQSIFLRTEDGSIEVETPQRNLFDPGDDVSVVCWPQLKNRQLTLTDGVVMRRDAGPSPEPVEILGLTEDVDAHLGELVTLEGTIRDFFISDRRYRILVGMDDGGTCSAYQNLRRDEAAPEPLPLGTRVRVTGIGHPRWEGAAVRDGASFGLMLRGWDDVSVTQPAPTVTRAELVALSWGLAFVAGLVGVGLGVMKRKVRRQEALIESITRTTAAADERRRIASEFHDNLNQHLVSASLHLETVQDALVKKPDVVPELVEDAVEVMRQCREEARSVIWNLRLGEGEKDLVELLRLWVEIRQKGSIAVKIFLHVEGESFPLTDEVTANVVRIAQEAVNNALHHASAEQVDLTLSYGPDRKLTLTVEDDGCGFTAPARPQGDTGRSADPA
jgi:hypothetical protein